MELAVRFHFCRTAAEVRSPARAGQFCFLHAKAGSIAVLPITARTGRPASRVIVRARKGGRGAMVLLSPFVLHDGAEHLQDGDDYSAAARAVLRDSGALSEFC